MPWWMTAALALLLLVALDRLLAAMELRGWIYYRHSPSRRPSAGHAMQSIEAIFRPQVQHVVDEQSAIGTDADEDGDPPEPPPPRRATG